MNAIVVDNYCSNSIYCEGGNCPGCKNGKQYCDDMRCNPNCTNCFIQPINDRFANTIFIVIIMFLLFVLFLFIFSQENHLVRPII